jgi:hypothetical protein
MSYAFEYYFEINYLDGVAWTYRMFANDMEDCLKAMCPHCCGLIRTMYLLKIESLNGVLIGTVNDVMF